MANITSAEAQTLWDNRFESCKCYNSETQESGTFVSYRFASNLDGVNYYVDSAADGVSVTHSSSAATVETNIKAHLETLEKVVLPASSMAQV